MTPRRFQQLKAILERRQPDLTVLLENVHKPHNFAAVVRTCDAVGVFEAHAVYPAGERISVGHLTAGGSGRWVTVRTHPDLSTAVARLRAADLRLVAAHPGADSVDFRQVDFAAPTAVLLGQEKDGLTAAALAAADVRVSIPMVGAGASLNVSVAAALILFEAQRQRAAAGFYERRRLDRDAFDRTLFEWAHPRVARLCRKRGAPYPRLGPEGEILDPVPR